ncbi:MAG: hypothetical protein KC417_14500 [Myxococcales bacterium]|nr:hypothetical protein [Myxococcales bacterium]
MPRVLCHGFSYRFVVAPLGLAVLVGCLSPVDPRAHSTSGSMDNAAFREPSFEIRTRGGMRVPDGAAPVQPEIALGFAAAPADPGDAIQLFEGPIDDALREDLEARPLRKANEARVLESRVRCDGTTCVLRPTEPLAKGRDYTVGVGAWLFPGKHGAYLRGFTTMLGPDAGVSIVAFWPADGTSGVPANMNGFLVGVDGLSTALHAHVEVVLDGVHARVQARTTNC